MLALNRGFSVGLSEKVIRTVPATMSLVAADGQDHVPVFLVVDQNFLETACHVEKLIAVPKRALEQCWLQVCNVLVHHCVIAHRAPGSVSLRLQLEHLLHGAVGQQRVKLNPVLNHHRSLGVAGGNLLALLEDRCPSELRLVYLIKSLLDVEGGFIDVLGIVVVVLGRTGRFVSSYITVRGRI